VSVFPGTFSLIIVLLLEHGWHSAQAEVLRYNRLGWEFRESSSLLVSTKGRVVTGLLLRTDKAERGDSGGLLLERQQGSRMNDCSARTSVFGSSR
jgi:hypothetical protein